MVFIRIDYVWVDDISDVFGGLFAGRKNKFFCRLCGIDLKTDKDKTDGKCIIEHLPPIKTCLSLKY